MNWELISKYLSGEMTLQERKSFENMVDENPEYKNALELAKKDLKQVEAFLKLNDAYDVDSAWESVQSKMKDEKSRSLGIRKMMTYAAAVLVLLSVGWLAFYNGNWGDKMRVVRAEITEKGKQVVLPDGTQVTLNAGAEISYPKHFANTERSVVFSGEGFFDVVSNPNVPFVIAANGAEVKVLGTSFNVNSSATITKVMVEEGKVQLRDLNNEFNLVILEKGEMGTFDKNSVMKSESKPANALSWKTQQMVFERTPLLEVVKVVENTYTITIEMPDGLADTLLLTSTFDHEPLEVILESIGKSFNLTYQINENKVQFSTAN